MKTLCTMLVLLFCSSYMLRAQSITYYNTNYFTPCQGSTVSLLNQPTVVPGLSPVDTSLPCGIRGSYMRDTIYFTNFSTFSSVAVDSLRIDSIYLPAGLCWSTNRVNNMFAGGASGAILISGTPTAPSGSYKLKIVADVYTSLINLTAVDLEALAHLRYHVRVSCPSYACTTIDPADSMSLYVPDNSSCSSQTISASITASGPTTFCDGGSVVLSTTYDTIYSYLWSNGSTTANTFVDVSGTYTVTVTQNGNSVVSQPVTVTVDPLPTAHFTLVQDPSAAHTWAVVNQCSGSSLAYDWSWGDNSSSSGATPTHTYDSAGYYSICVSLIDQNGCQSFYCDSNAYLYKAEGQMVTVRVVQYALGTTEIGERQIKMIYYAGAIHLSDNIADPSEVAVYDMSGRLVVSQKAWTGTALPLDDSLTDGVYVVRLQNKNMRLAGRIGIVR